MEQLFFLHSQSLNSVSPNLPCCLRSVLHHDPSGCWPECLHREVRLVNIKSRSARDWWSRWIHHWRNVLKWAESIPEEGGWQDRYLQSNQAVVFKITAHDNIYMESDLKFLTHYCYLTSKEMQECFPAKMVKPKRKFSIDYPDLLSLLMDSSNLLSDIRV